jgi:flagellin
MGFRISQGMSLRFSRLIAERQASISTRLMSLASNQRLTSFRQDVATSSNLQKIEADIRGLSQASLNVQEARSVVTTAQSALTDLQEVSSSLLELAEEAAGSITSERRLEIQAETTELLAFFESRLAEAKSGTRQLFQSNQNFSVQVGPRRNQSYGFSIGTASSAVLGQFAQYSSEPRLINQPLGTGLNSVSINGFALPSAISDGVSSNYSNTSAIARAASINSVSSKTGVTATVQENERFLAFSGDSLDFIIGGYDLTRQNLRLNGEALTGTVTSAADFADSVNLLTETTGVSAEIYSVSGTVTTIRFFAEDGRNIQFQMDAADKEGDTGDFVYKMFNPFDEGSTDEVASDFDINFGSLGLLENSSIGSLGDDAIDITGSGVIQLSSDSDFLLEGGKTFTILGIDAGNYKVQKDKALFNIQVDSISNATNAVRTLELTQQSLSSLQAQVDSIGRRLDFSASSISRQQEALTNTRDRLTQVDIPQILSQITADQLIQDSAVAALTQANLNSQEVARSLFSSLLFRR